MAILISKSLSYAKWADVDGAKRQAACRSRCWGLVLRAAFLSFFLSTRVFATLISSYSLLRILSFPTSSYFHIPTQRISLAYPCEATNASIPDTPGRRRNTGRAARLYASATLNHSLEITYVWIDSYYYKAYVGRACAVGGPTIDSPDWPAV